MTVLESEVAGLRRKAALAMDLTARVLVLSEEITHAVKEDHRLAENCAARAKRSKGELSSLAAVLREFGTFERPSIRKSGARPGRAPFDPALFIAVLQRQSHLRTLSDARDERERLTRARSFASGVVEDHQRLAQEWIADLAELDSELGTDLIRLEDEECRVLTHLARLEEGQILARDAEKSLVHLLKIFHGAVDHVAPPGTASGETKPVLRPERLDSVDAAIFDAQAMLTSTRRSLGGTPYLDAGVFQVELLSDFAGMCIASLGRDLEERDGTSRAARAVSWTLATVRALRGYLARSEFEEKHALDGLRFRRTRLLSKSRS